MIEISETNDVATKLKSPFTDGIAWPRIAGYNDHSLEKGKTLPFKGATVQPEAPEASTQQSMVIVSNYQLIENPEKGVFCCLGNYAFRKLWISVELRHGN